MNSCVWDNAIFCNGITEMNTTFQYTDISKYIKFPYQIINYTEKGIEKIDPEVISRSFKLKDGIVPQIRQLQDRVVKIIKVNNLQKQKFDTSSKIGIIGLIANLQKKGCNKYCKIIARRSDLDNVQLNKTLNHRKKKWDEILGINDDKIYPNSYWIEKNINLKSLQFGMYYRHIQYKINKGTLKTNRLTRFWGDKNPYCTFCKNEIETIPHLFWDCNIVIGFLLDAKYFLKKVWPAQIDYTKITREYFLFGYKKESWHSETNFTLTLIKHYIWKQKRDQIKPEIETFKVFFKDEVLQWNFAQKMDPKEIKLNFLLLDHYQKIIKKWKY